MSCYVPLFGLLAYSPVFTNQQFTDEASDADSNYCRVDSGPELVAVTYSSDGRELKATVWLNSSANFPFTLTGNPIEIADEAGDLYIQGSASELGATNLQRELGEKFIPILYTNGTHNLNFSVYPNDKTAIRNIQINLTNNSPNSTNLNDLNEEKINLPFALNSSELRSAIVELVPPNLIIVGNASESAVTDLRREIEGEKFIPLICENETYQLHVIFSSINQTDFDFEIFFLTKANSMELLPIPSSTEVSYKDYEKVVTVLPFLNSTETKFTIYNLPRYESENVTKFDARFSMYIDLLTVHDTGWDYVNTIKWEPENQTWVRHFEQFQPSSSETQDKRKLLYTNFSSDATYVGLDDSNNTYVDLPLDLSDLHYPPIFRILFQMLIKAQTDDNNKCDWFDRTGSMTVPPPKIELFASPNSLELVPHERKSVILTANSSTALDPAEVSFTVGEDPVIRVEGPFPNKTKLVAGGIATSELEVMALDSAEKKNTVIQATVSATFPSPKDINPITGELDDTNTTITNRDTFIPITIKPPKGIPEQMGEAFDSGFVVLNKFGAAVTTLGAVATGIVGFVAFWKKRSNKDKEAQRT